jgi:hypothetical protein
VRARYGKYCSETLRFRSGTFIPEKETATVSAIIEIDVLSYYVERVVFIDKYVYSRNRIRNIVVTRAVKANYQLGAAASTPNPNTEAISGGNALILANEVDLIGGALGDGDRLQGDCHTQKLREVVSKLFKFQAIVVYLFRGTPDRIHQNSGAGVACALRRLSSGAVIRSSGPRVEKARSKKSQY